MALPPQYVDISISGGLDAKTDRKLVKAPATITADNVQFSTSGSVRKRYGIQFIAQPSSNNVQSLGNTNDELLATDASYLYNYNVDANAWTNRGVAAQCAVGTQSLGGYQLPASFGASDANLRGLTFDVINGIGLLAFDTGDNTDSGNGCRLNYIQLICFDVGTGKTIWEQRITQPFYIASEQKDIITAGVQTPSAYGTIGCGHPLIRAHKGQFYLAFTSAATGFTTNGGTGAYPSFIYGLEMYRLNADIRNSIPIITSSSYSNCTRLAFTNASNVQPAGARQFTQNVNPVGAPIWYDMATNGQTLWLSMSATYYGMKPGDSQSRGGEGFQSFAIVNNSTTVMTRFQSATLPSPIVAGCMAVTHTPINADGTLPGDAQFITTFANGCFSYRDPQLTSTPALGTYFFTGPMLTASQPISARAVGSSSSGYQVYMTDGLAYQRLALSALGNFTLVKNGPVVVDYALPFGTLIAQSSHSTGPFLQSRIFLAPDGQPVCWVMLQLYDNGNFNCLALVNVGDAVTPVNSVYAHAFYLRTGAALYGKIPSNVVNNAILAFQITDKANLTGVIKRISIAAEPYPTICKLYQGALITGGDTKYYDGKQCRTMGWLKFPEYPNFMQCTPAVTGVTGTSQIYPPGLQDRIFSIYDTNPRSLPLRGGKQDPDPGQASSINVITMANQRFFSAGGYGLIAPSVGFYNVTQNLFPDFAYSYIFVYVDFDAYGNAIYSSPSPCIYLQGTGSVGKEPVNGAPSKRYTPASPGTYTYSNVQRKQYRYSYFDSAAGKQVDVFYQYNFYENYSFVNTPYVPAIYGDILNPTRGKCLVYRNSKLDPNNYHIIPPLTYMGGTSFQVPAPTPVTGTFYDPVTSITGQDGITRTSPYQPFDTLSMVPPAGYYDLSPDDNTQNPLIYSQPAANNQGVSGELPNDPPPPSTFAVTTTRRPFVSSAENRNWIYYGKPYRPGRAPEFNSGSVLEIDPPSGDITGLAVLDQNVIIFKREKIFVLAGTGPDGTGSGVFNDTYAVATDTGCLDSNSIVTTETGVYFRSIRGMQMIDRSLQVSYPGAIVERIINGSTVTSAVLVPGQNEIRWALRSNNPTIAGTAEDNVVLVLDYLQGKWSQYRFNPGYDPRYSLRVAGQANFRDNAFTLAGNAIFQDAGPQSTYGAIGFKDAARDVPMVIETGWIPLSGPQGWGRLRRVNILGDFRSAHDLKLSFAYDYNDEYTHSVTYTPASTSVKGDAQNWRVRAPRQVAQAVKFKIEDSGSDESIVITGLELETSQKSGATRVPDAQSV